MLLRYSFQVDLLVFYQISQTPSLSNFQCYALIQMEDEAQAIEMATEKVLTDGLRTGDLTKDSSKQIGTVAMGNAVVEVLEQMHVRH